MASFEVYNDDGRLQVSDSAVGLVFKIVFPLQPPPSLNYHNERFYALQPAVDKKISTNYFGSALTDPGKFGNFLGYGRVFTFSYDYLPPPAVDYGLEVYDENGTICYSSNLLTVDILEVVKITATSTSDLDGVFFSRDYGTTDIAIIPVRLAEWLSGAYQWILAFEMVGTELRTSRIPLINFPGANIKPNFGSFPCEFIVIGTKGY